MPSSPAGHLFPPEENILDSRISSYSRILLLCWTVLICASWSWNYYAEHKVFHKVAHAEASAVIERDALYRRWGSSHGGVYAPITPKNPPNEHLVHIPERDISSPSGKPLTLINPAYMTRQVNDLAAESSAFLGRAHLTSLQPLRPENAADPWESEALKSFESGVQEASIITTINGKPYLRLMRPFVTEKPCLKCHINQGYTVGSIRGGISVSIPIQPLIDTSRGQAAGSLAFHGVIWLLGIAVTGFGKRQLIRSARIQKQVEVELHQQTVQLEQEIAERQMAQESLQESEELLKVVADYSSNWEYWRLPNNSFQYISPSVISLTGYSVAEFSADSGLLLRTIHPEDRPLFEHHTHEVDTQGHILPLELRIIHKDGSVRWISHICQPVFTPYGLPWGWRASNQDITERKAMEQELFRQTEALEEEVAERENAQNKLEEINISLEKRITEAVTELRLKDQRLIQQSRLASMGEMINNIAHQWRQPLNNVGLIIQNLQFSYEVGTLTPEEMTQEIEKAMDVIMHMSRTIDDFRNFFRDDKQKAVFSVNDTVHKALDFVTAALTSSSIKVILDEMQNVTATGYQNEYAQVILNILANTRNACMERKTANPHIHIRISAVNGCSIVSISDNCGGIPDEILPKIFDPYFTTRSPDKGTGIGLYMSKVIVEQNMNGRLTARNSGDGAEFIIEI